MCRTYATCTLCKCEFPVTSMVATESRKRGNRVHYICSRCATQNRGYHASNEKVCGTDKVNAIFDGIEFETSFTDDYARNVMSEYDFIPTHDCSLESDGDGNRYGHDGNTCEYVSPLMKGLNKASKFALSCQYLIDNGHMSVNDSCGTHFHVSINSMKDASGSNEGYDSYMSQIRRFYHSLFTPLSNAMKADREKTIKVFGRYFTEHYDEYNTLKQGYASSIDWNGRKADPRNRYYFINATNGNNIEFRLNKFVDARQFQNLMKMEVEMTKCIVKNFCEHFMDEDFDRTRYEDERAYRKHKADVTASKLVKIFEKYANC